MSAVGPTRRSGLEGAGAFAGLRARFSAKRLLALTREPSAGTLIGVMSALTCAALWAITHPYMGIVGDARIYLGRVLADFDPAGVGRDLMFVHDGQSRFSLFTPLADAVVAQIGLRKAAIFIAAAASASWFVALSWLAGALAPGRGRWAIVLVVAMLPASYGAQRFFFAETNAVPRPFAEAMVMASLTLLIRGRRGSAFSLSGLACLVHPIMAVVGIAVCCVTIAWHDRRVVVAAALGAALVLIGAWAGLPFLQRLIVVMDPAWIGTVSGRGSHLFVRQWPPEAFANLLIQAATILLAAHLLGGVAGRVLAATIFAAAALLLTSLVFADGLSLLLFVQAQFWRATWLIAALGSACFALCSLHLWRRGQTARLSLAFLGLAWIFANDIFVGPVLSGVALALQLGATYRPLPLKPLHLTAAVVTAACVVVILALFQAAGVFVAYLRYLNALSPDDHVTLADTLNGRFFTLPACACIVAWALRENRGSARRGLRVAAAASGLAVTMLVAGFVWDDRPPIRKLIDSGERPASLNALFDAPAGEVLWIDGLVEAWYLLGRPQWASAQQGVSTVFSQSLAAEWRRRMAILVDLGLAARTSFEAWAMPANADITRVSTAGVRTLCARPDGPAWIVAPVYRGESIQADLVGRQWPLPVPYFVLSQDEGRYTDHRVDAFAVLACRNPGNRYEAR